MIEKRKSVRALGIDRSRAKRSASQTNISPSTVATIDVRNPGQSDDRRQQADGPQRLPRRAAPADPFGGRRVRAPAAAECPHARNRRGTARRWRGSEASARRTRCRRGRGPAARYDRSPRLQPMTGGSAPGIAPTSVGKRRLQFQRRVDQHVADQGGGSDARRRDVDRQRQLDEADAAQERGRTTRLRAVFNRPPGSGRVRVRRISASVSALPDLVERRRTTGDQRSPHQRVHQKSGRAHRSGDAR